MSGRLNRLDTTLKENNQQFPTFSSGVLTTQKKRLYKNSETYAP